MQTASIYKLKDRFLIHADSRTTAGVWIACEPFLPLPLASDASCVGDAALSALARSSDAVPHPTEWHNAAVQRLTAAGVRSERTFQSCATLVTITRDDSGYCLEPHYTADTSGNGKGFHPRPDSRRSISLDCEVRSIGAALLEMLG